MNQPSARHTPSAKSAKRRGGIWSRASISALRFGRAAAYLCRRGRGGGRADTGGVTRRHLERRVARLASAAVIDRRPRSPKRRAKKCPSSPSLLAARGNPRDPPRSPRARPLALDTRAAGGCLPSRAGALCRGAPSPSRAEAESKRRKRTVGTRTDLTDCCPARNRSPKTDLVRVSSSLVPSGPRKILPRI